MDRQAGPASVTVACLLEAWEEFHFKTSIANGRDIDWSGNLCRDREFCDVKDVYAIVDWSLSPVLREYGVADWGIMIDRVLITYAGEAYTTGEDEIEVRGEILYPSPEGHGAPVEDDDDAKALLHQARNTIDNRKYIKDVSVDCSKCNMEYGLAPAELEVDLNRSTIRVLFK